MLDITNKKKSIHEIFASYFDDKDTATLALAVSTALEEGNICLDINKYKEITGIKPDIEKIKNSPYVGYDEKTIKPFIFKNNKIYLHRYFNYETIILNQIKKLIQTGETNIKQKKQILENNKDLIFSLFTKKNTGQTDWRAVAVINAFLNNFSIITGGPGTGKTSTIVKLLVLSLKLDTSMKIALAAPTGKAAVRMTESLSKALDHIKISGDDIKTKITSLQSRTIHRLLGVDYRNPHTFIHNSDNPLSYDMIIIDEASMIGTSLMAKLLSAIEPRTKVVMMGDKNQLSPVEAGSIFGDLCKVNTGDKIFTLSQSKFFSSLFDNNDFYGLTATNCNLLTGKIVELKKSYRFDEHKGIGKFSKFVLSAKGDDIVNGLATFKNCRQKEQCVKIINDYDLNAIKDILNLFEQYANEDNIPAALEKLNKVKILCAVKEGKYGISYYNSLIEKHLNFNPRRRYTKGFYDRQAIIITYNDYNLGLFNGDTGIIRKDKNTGNYYFYYFDEKKELKKILAASINNYDTAFALTIHKSQGSEYENVLLVLPENPGMKLLTKELVYTAVTRASHSVTILSGDDTLASAVSRHTERISGIKERISKTDCDSHN